MMTSRIEIRLDAETKAWLYEQASKAQNTHKPNYSRYIRSLIQQEKGLVNEEVKQQMDKLYGELNRWGNNLNQIARSANIGVFREADKQRVFTLLGQAISAIHDLERSVLHTSTAVKQ